MITTWSSLSSYLVLGLEDLTGQIEMTSTQFTPLVYFWAHLICKEMGHFMFLVSKLLRNSLSIKAIVADIWLIVIIIMFGTLYLQVYCSLYQIVPICWTFLDCHRIKYISRIHIMYILMSCITATLDYCNDIGCGKLTFSIMKDILKCYGHYITRM